MPSASVVATILLCAFVIDRIIASVMFVASFLEVSRAKTKKALATRKELRRKFIFFVLAGSLGLLAIYAAPGLGLDLNAFPKLSPAASAILTWLVLVAGADRISSFIGVGSEAPPADEETESVEVHVAGTLRVDPETAAKIAGKAEAP